MTQEINYKEEVERLQINNFLKLESGRHEIKFLDNGVSETNQINNSDVEQRTYKVLYKGQEAFWSITKSDYLNSLYGKLMLLGNYYKDITGRVFDVLVEGSGKSKKYTILQAVELLKEEIERRERLQSQPTVENEVM